MPRPKLSIRPRLLHVSLPEDLLARVDLELFSPLEGRIPAGSYQRLLTKLLTDWLAQQGGSREAE